ncbi:MAG: hypothetical protein ABR573_07495 [Candidatus Dormibacteria bacterium]
MRPLVLFGRLLAVPHLLRQNGRVEDSIDIRLPRRDWGLAAAQDLRSEGCRATLAECADCDGLWVLRVCGPERKIAMMRYELNLAGNRVCWESFINGMHLGS